MRRTQSESPSEVTPWSETKQVSLLGPEPELKSQATPETPHPSMPEPEPGLGTGQRPLTMLEGSDPSPLKPEQPSAVPPRSETPHPSMPEP